MATKYPTSFYPRGSYDAQMIENNRSIEHYKGKAAGAKARGNKDEAAAANAIANMKEQDNETILQRLYKPNSRAQYEHEKAVGDPSARDLSYEEWKKL
jgi:hypothetical protein